MSQSVYERVKAILDETPLLEQRQRTENDRVAVMAILDCASELSNFNPLKAGRRYDDICAEFASRLLGHCKDKCEHEPTA